LILIERLWNEYAPFGEIIGKLVAERIRRGIMVMRKIEGGAGLDTVAEAEGRNVSATSISDTYQRHVLAT
jgi:hypothetical protein